MVKYVPIENKNNYYKFLKILQSLFLPFEQEKRAFYAVWAYLGYFDIQK